MNKRKWLCLLTALCMLLTMLCACGQNAETSTDTSAASQEQTEENTPKIGISFPNDTETKWQEDSAIINEQLQAAGYDCELMFASDSSDTQKEQIQTMISDGCTVLIVAAVDPNDMARAFNNSSIATTISGGSADAESEAAESAAESSAADVAASSVDTSVESENELAEVEIADDSPIDDGLTVIAYDRLITDCSAVDYYVGFDGYEAGYLQASYIEDVLNLYDTTETYNIELFFGDPNDIEAENQYEGALEVLQVYLDSGVLNIPSGQADLTDCSVLDADAAAARMDTLMQNSDDAAQLDAVLCAEDWMAQAVVEPLFSSYTGMVYPLITGKGCEEASVNHIAVNGTQSMTLLLDCTGMAEEAADAAITFMNGETPESTDSLDNGQISVPASLFFPEQVFATNYREMLVQRGYFTENSDGTLSAVTDYTMGYTAPAEDTTASADSSAAADETSSAVSSGTESAASAEAAESTDAEAAAANESAA